MEQAVATGVAEDVDAARRKDLEDFVTFFINNQMFGIPVLKVQDILTPDRIAPIPLTPPEIRGYINLRGRIVTVVDVRVRLGVEKRLPDKTAAAAAKGTHRREGVSQPAADGSGTADENAHPAQEESPDEASRPAAQGNGAAEDANGSVDAGERPADDENRPAGGASPPVDEDTNTAGAQDMCVTVEHENELYTLLVDRVGDVIGLSDDSFEDNPSTLDVVWREFALGVYRLESALMVVLDVGHLLDIKSVRD
jgi:purine-binding chemotaxis protein CheW